MMPDDQPRLLRAHPHACHPRVAIGINKVNIPGDEDVLVVRAARCQDENAQKGDFDETQDCANHTKPAISLPAAVSNPKFSGGRPPSPIEDWTLDVRRWMFARQRGMGL